MRRMRKIYVILTIMSILIFPVVAIDNQSISSPITYRILIDQNYGFFRTFELHDKMSGKEMYQENGTLNISKGDIVIFVSDATPDRMLTIISEEKLWSDKNGILRHGGKEFSYIFNKSGMYNIYIKERPLLKQRIIVSQIDIGAIDIIDTESNLVNDIELGSTNVNRTQSLTNVTESNLVRESSQTNIILESTSNRSNSTSIISVGLTGDLYDKTRSWSGTFMLTIILIGMYIMSVRIKED